MWYNAGLNGMQRPLHVKTRKAQGSLQLQVSISEPLRLPVVPISVNQRFTRLCNSLSLSCLAPAMVQVKNQLIPFQVLVIRLAIPGFWIEQCEPLAYMHHQTFPLFVNNQGPK